MNVAEMGAAITAALARRNVYIADGVAATALKHNSEEVIGLAFTGMLLALRGTAAVLSAILAGKGGSDVIDYLKDDGNTAAMDAHPEGLQWEDEGFTITDPVTGELITLPPVLIPGLPGYETPAVPGVSGPSIESFPIYNGPSSSIITSDREEFTLPKTAIIKVYKHDRFGKFYKNKEDGYYYTKDKAGHGGSAWKVYKETAKGLEWEKDLDKFGKEMESKHKGDVGKFIPKKDLSGGNGK